MIFLLIMNIFSYVISLFQNEQSIEESSKALKNLLRNVRYVDSIRCQKQNVIEKQFESIFWLLCLLRDYTMKNERNVNFVFVSFSFLFSIKYEKFTFLWWIDLGYGFNVTFKLEFCRVCWGFFLQRHFSLFLVDVFALCSL